MNTADQIDIRTRSSTSSEELLDAVLKPLFGLLRCGGFGRQEIEAAFGRAMDSVSQLSLSRPSQNLGLQLRDCMEVMCIWRRDTDFLNEDGSPAMLDIRPLDAGFHALCAKAAARTQVTQLLATLDRFDAINWHGETHVSPATPTFIVGATKNGDALALDGVLKLLAGYLRTIQHNVIQAQQEDWRPKFERACLVTIPKELIPVFERTVAERGQDFIDSLDEWLERHLSDTSPSGQYVELGAGAYSIDLGPAEPPTRPMANGKS